MKRFKRLYHALANSLGIIRCLDRWKLPLMLAKAVVISVVPFVVIVMSAEIINRLSSGADFQSTLIYAIISVIVIFALTLLGDYLKKLNEVKNNHVKRLYDFSKNEKMMEMDFAELESPAASSLRAKLRAEENMGFNLPLLLTSLDTFSESLLTAVLALILLINAAALTGGIPAAGLTVFFLLSVLLSVTASMLQKKMNDKLLDQLKDDDFWPDSVLQSDAMTYGSVFTYKAGKDIRIYGFQDIIRGCLTEGFKYLLNVSKSFAMKPALVYGAVGAVRGLIMGASHIFAAVYVSGGGAPLGSVLLFASALYQFVYGISRVITVFSGIISVAESLRLYTQFMSVQEPQHKGTLSVEKLADHEYSIEFCSVSFKYPGSGTFALKNLNLRFNTGKRMAVVGMNGSGKTTMIKLLCRLYEPTDGEILLNGKNIAEYDLDEYRSIFSVVFQDFKLPSFEIGKVLSAQTEYDSQRVENCLRHAGLSERLTSMPDGINTFLYKDFEDGVEISGGEAQKIAIARALYKDAPFIVLDEPTAALDPISEFEVYSKFNDIIGEKTAVFISHRLSSCRFCDDIAVFHEGELIQRGKHDELLADGNGKYNQLWNAQADYYSDLR